MSTEHEETLGKFDARLLRRLLGYALPHRRLFGASLMVLIVGFLLELVGPDLVRRAIDGPIAAFQLDEITRSEANRGLALYLGFYVGLVLLLGWIRYAEVIVMARTGQNVIYDIRNNLFSHLQRLSLSFYDRHPVGRLVTRATGDVEALNELFTSGVVVMLRDLIKIAFIIIFLFTIHSTLALVVLAFAPGLVALSMIFRNKARTSYHIVRGKNAVLNGFLTEVLSGARVVQLFGQHAKVRRRYSELSSSYFKANLKTIFYFALFYPMIELIIYGMEGTIILTAADGMSTGSITRGELLQFWMTLGILVGPIRELGEKYNVLQAAMASSERIFRVLDTEPQILAPDRPFLPAGKASRIEFDRVTFGYDEETPVLRNVSFDVEPGSKIAIVGATGAGKSTIISLLTRFYDPRLGEVRIDGRDVRDFDPSELRRRIALVPQDVFLFAGTIEENITLGREGITSEDVRRAAEGVCASRFIEALPEGYGAPVAERGATFSTGERQLLAFARALAGDPDIVVLDEATAHIDTETETWIQQGIVTLLEGRTSVVIAHRLSTITSADQILVLHHGEVRERGTHAELLQLGGIYSKLYRLQFQ